MKTMRGILAGAVLLAFVLTWVAVAEEAAGRTGEDAAGAAVENQAEPRITDAPQPAQPGEPAGPALQSTQRQFTYLRLAAGAACVILLVTIVELVRRRKLRIEYSWIWFLTASAMLILSLWYDLLIAITRLIFLKGPDEPVAPRETLYFFGMLFLLCICLHFSVKISRLTDQVKVLAQNLSLHAAGVDDKPAAAGNGDKEPGPQ